jgi:hypothetical protein
MNTNHSHTTTILAAEAQVEGACSLCERVGNGLQSQPSDLSLTTRD